MNGIGMDGKWKEWGRAGWRKENGGNERVDEAKDGRDRG